jgi:transposase
MSLYCGLKIPELCVYFKKDRSTIYHWLHQFANGDGVDRKRSAMVVKKFGLEKRSWLVKLYHKKPTLFLDEAVACFRRKFHFSISKSHLCTILHQEGLTWKVLERRAMQICYQDVIRFCNELREFPWLLENLVFLDEVGFDNRSMLRKRGYGMKSKRLVFRGEFNRKPRVSLLCFIGLKGVLDTFSTDGTFDRSVFMACCREFALNNDAVRPYPGRHSVWILDGAIIHCHPNIVYYLRSLGIVPIFLPAYCPFFNPIEVFFSRVKSMFRRTYVENSKVDLKLIVARVLNCFKNCCFKPIFKKCGWSATGFDGGVAFNISAEDF